MSAPKWISRHWTALLAFIISFLVYLFTLCPTVHWDDAGELIAACYTLGIPHPPGHPLYVIIGKLFTLIPMGSIAWRVNLMSAFFGALCTLLVYRIIRDALDENPWSETAALGGALFFAFSPTVWEQSTIAETTTLHNFFMMTLTLLVFRMASGDIPWKNEVRSLCLFSFIYGVSHTNHVGGVFFFPSIAYLLLVTYKQRLFSPRLIIGIPLSFFIGLLVYAYLPIRSLANPPIDWGNPENLENFIWVVTARQFAPGLAKTTTIPMIVVNIGLRAQDLFHQLTPLGCILAVIGLFRMARRKPHLVVYCILVIGTLFYIGLNSAFISAYYVPGFALIGVWIGIGIRQTMEWICLGVEKLKDFSFAGVMSTSLCCILALSFVLPLGIHYRDMDRSDQVYALRYGEHMLEQLPGNSLLFTVNGHALFILWYLIHCEGDRPDLMVIEPTWLVGSKPLSSEIIEQYPSLQIPKPEVIKQYTMKATDPELRRMLTIQSFLDANYSHHPVYWGMIPGNVPFLRNLIPQGMLFRYSVSPIELDNESLERNWDYWNSERDFLLKNQSMKDDAIALEIYPVELNNQGLIFEQLGRNDLARSAFEFALDFNPKYPISRYNLGRLEAREGNYEKAVQEYEIAVRGNPYMAVAYYGLGNAYRSLNRLEEAFLAYRKAVRRYPEYYEALTAMGQMYHLAGDKKSAAKSFKRAIEIEPGYGFALRGLAIVYIETGKLDQARQLLDRALNLEPDSAPALFALAKYYWTTGDNAKAEEALRQSVDIGGADFLNAAKNDETLSELVHNMQIEEEKT